MGTITLDRSSLSSVSLRFRPRSSVSSMVLSISSKMLSRGCQSHKVSLAVPVLLSVYEGCFFFFLPLPCCYCQCTDMTTVLDGLFQECFLNRSFLCLLGGLNWKKPD